MPMPAHTITLENRKMGPIQRRDRPCGPAHEQQKAQQTQHIQAQDAVQAALVATPHTGVSQHRRTLRHQSVPTLSAVGGWALRRSARLSTQAYSTTMAMNTSTAPCEAIQ